MLKTNKIPRSVERSSYPEKGSQSTAFVRDSRADLSNTTLLSLPLSCHHEVILGEARDPGSRRHDHRCYLEARLRHSLGPCTFICASAAVRALSAFKQSLRYLER